MGQKQNIQKEAAPLYKKHKAPASFMKEMGYMVSDDVTPPEDDIASPEEIKEMLRRK